MKTIASILITSLMFLGVNDFLEQMHPQEIPAETACEHCRHDAEDPGDRQEKESHEKDHECSPGCECNCCFHITALEYHFLTLPGTNVGRYHYADYTNTYHFEFSSPFFEPPRFC